MKVLITGANFLNKGAQSMLFITVDELKKRCRDVEVYFSSNESLNLSNYQFRHVYRSLTSQKIALSDKKYTKAYVKAKLSDIKKMLTSRPEGLWRSDDLRKLMPDISLMIDVSGFAIGEKWPARIQEIYLNNIRLAKRYGIPMYLMPQSFGGFDYSEDQKYLLPAIGELLQYPAKIFVREPQGYEDLVNKFGLQNVVLSTDLVLQNAGIDLGDIFRSAIAIEVPQLETEDNVAIIPNNQCFKYGSKETILAIYTKVIDALLEKGKNVYIFRHSSEDLNACKLIYETYQDDPAVHILDNAFSCLEYDAFVKQFSFIVCSRFHGIVHAYRNAVPAIALGWEIKYDELTKKMDQGEYVFNIVGDAPDADMIADAVREMCDHHAQNSRRISEKLAEVRSDNCFDYITELKS